MFIMLENYVNYHLFSMQLFKGACHMKKNPVIIDPNMKNGYIPAPYVLEEGEKINDMYLEPVLFHNENGPTLLMYIT